jgi:hypothetical protein
MADLIITIIIVLLGRAWVNFRQMPLRGIDMVFILTGVLSILWMHMWMKSKKASKQSLMIPWFPIFLIPLIGILGPQLKLFSGFEGMNMIILFYLGFMFSFGVSGLIYKKKK